MSSRQMPVDRTQWKMLGERLASARKRAGMSQRQLAAEMGGRYDQTIVSRVETGKSGFLGEGLVRAAEILSVSIDYLLGLTNDPTPSHILADLSNEEKANALDVVPIPKVAAIVGDGRGEENYDETILERLPFSRRLLTDLGINPEGCHFAVHQGAGMEPTLPDGCTILVDPHSREFRDGGIFLLQFEEHVMDQTAKYLSPVRLFRRRGLREPSDSHWCLRFDGDGVSGWPLTLYDIKRVIGEVVLVMGPPGRVNTQ